MKIKYIKCEKNAYKVKTDKKKDTKIAYIGNWNGKGL